jgi:transcriptional regulator GlxA family with amidase domain
LSRVSRNAASADGSVSTPGRGSAAGAGAETAPPGGTGGEPPNPAGAARKLSGRRRPEIVAVLLFSGAPIFESSIPLSVFGVDRQDAGVPRYRLLVCAGEEGPLATTGGLTMTAPHGLESLGRAGTVVVPAWRSAAQLPPPEALAALRKAHQEGARIIGLCTGAFVLAAAGLLDGRPATTHWMYAPTLAKRYPQVQVDPRELFIDDGDVLTSAGTAAGIDLCLHVVRTDHGAEAAAALARRLVVPARRSGGQAQYIDRSLPEEIGNDPLAEVVTWALDNLSKQFDVEALAARAYMSRRTFDRRFRSLTGSAPLQWLISQRVLQAQRLLETTEASVDEVARRCGFRSPVALRGHFRRQLGMSPAVYRTAFRARRPQPGAADGASAPSAIAAGLGGPSGLQPFTAEDGGAPVATPPPGQQGGNPAAPDARADQGRVPGQSRASRTGRVSARPRGGRPDATDHAAAEDGRTEAGARGRRESAVPEPRDGSHGDSSAGPGAAPPGVLPARGRPDGGRANGGRSNTVRVTVQQRASD